jgi:hypothetical protein
MMKKHEREVHSLTQRIFAHHATWEDRLVGKSPQYSCSLQARKSGETIMSHYDSARVTVAWMVKHRVCHSVVCKVQLFLCIIRQHSMNLLVKWNCGTGAYAKP